MIERFLSVFNFIDTILWGPWTLAFFGFAALFFTIKSKFFQVTHFKFILKNTFGKIFSPAPSSIEGKGMMSPFQAVTTSLAGTVGMGNIAGVAVALSIGGPGAIFWMWLLAIFAMMLKTVEITLGVHYRSKDELGARGGPMYYITKGLGWKPLAILYSVGMITNSVLASSVLQSHTVARAFHASYAINPYLVTGFMIGVTALVILGGVSGIGKFSERMVPVMSLVYIIGGLIIIIINIATIPQVFQTIFHYAFSPYPAAGGLAGISIALTIKQGVARGMQSNEAGLGTGAIVHATATTSHPFQQGIWGAFEVFIDTIIICTITSFVVLSTGALTGTETGVDMVLKAFSMVFSESVARALISFAILTFCLSTMIGFYIYYETSITHLFGKKYINYFKIIYLIPGIIVADFQNADQLWVIANVSVGVVAIPNLVAVLSLHKVFFKLMHDRLSGRNQYATEVIDVSKDYIRKAGD